MAGPYCTLLLADAGAEVIKIERLGGGDPRRAMPPFAEKGGARKAAGFMGYNRNKKSLALNLRDPRGREVFRKLAMCSDVVVENLRPGSMSKMGLGHKDMRALKPELVWAIISGFGRMDGFRGPYADRPAFDIVAEGMSGMMDLVGFADKPPSWTIYGLADIYSGLVTAFGITQALLMRQRTGRGQLVDSAMFDNMLSLNEQMVSYYSVAGEVLERGRPKNYYPRGAFRTKDGYLALHCPNDILWKRLAGVLDRPDLAEDERTATATARCANIELLEPIINDALASMTRDEAVEKFNGAGVPCGPVNTVEDIFRDPQVEARHMLMPVDDPKVGSFRFARTPPHLSEAPEPPAEPAPELGQHTREILEGLLDYTPSDVDALEEDGVVETGE